MPPSSLWSKKSIRLYEASCRNTLQCITNITVVAVRRLLFWVPRLREQMQSSHSASATSSGSSGSPAVLEAITQTLSCPAPLVLPSYSLLSTQPLGVSGYRWGKKKKKTQTAEAWVDAELPYNQGLNRIPEIEMGGNERAAIVKSIAPYQS